MKQARFLIPLFAFLFISSTILLAQYPEDSGHPQREDGLDMVMIFGLLELSFLLVCIYYSFKTANALQGGVFGTGMKYLAWGFLVMAVGHLVMQVHHIFHYDIFRDTFGYVWGNILWFIVLIITWGLSAFGFYKIYNVSKTG